MFIFQAGDLGKSDVPLKGDIKSPLQRPFIPTESEWAAREIQSKQIIGEDRLSIDGSSTIYTVPKNHEFFLTSAALTLSHQNGTDTVAAFFRMIRGGVISTPNLIDIFKFEIEGHFNVVANSLSFPMPLKLREDDEIVLRYDEDALASGEAQMFFCGWERSKNVVPET